MSGHVRALFAEVAGTFMFFFIGAGAIVAAVASGGDGIGSLAVAADIFVGGGLTGAAMNPARWLGPAVVAGFYDNWYVYWIGPLIGAAIGGLSYRYIFAPPADLG